VRQVVFKSLLRITAYTHRTIPTNTIASPLWPYEVRKRKLQSPLRKSKERILLIKETARRARNNERFGGRVCAASNTDSVHWFLLGERQKGKVIWCGLLDNPVLVLDVLLRQPHNLMRRRYCNISKCPASR
jgi:hypothetical protein